MSSKEKIRLSLGEVLVVGGKAKAVKTNVRIRVKAQKGE
jgi:hypothetical protein